MQAISDIAEALERAGVKILATAFIGRGAMDRTAPMQDLAVLTFAHLLPQNVPGFEPVDTYKRWWRNDSGHNIRFVFDQSELQRYAEAAALTQELYTAGCPLTRAHRIAIYRAICGR